MTDKTTPSTKRRATGSSAKAGQKRSRASRPAATPLRHHTDAPRATRTRPDMAPDAEARRIAAQAVEAGSGERHGAAPRGPSAEGAEAAIHSAVQPAVGLFAMQRAMVGLLGSAMEANWRIAQTMMRLADPRAMIEGPMRGPTR